jgi:hypothetical protein
MTEPLLDETGAGLWMCGTLRPRLGVGLKDFPGPDSVLLIGDPLGPGVTIFKKYIKSREALQGLSRHSAGVTFQTSPLPCVKSFGVRRLVAAFSRADLSVRSSSPQPVAVRESGDELPHSELIVATGCIVGR